MRRRSPKPGEPCPKPTTAESSQNFIKRIVAGPGDTLSVKEGHPVVNGVEKTDEPYISPCGSAAACNMPRTIKIPPDHYFMMGDNRGASDDSRFWGPVPEDWIIGEAFATYWPPTASAPSKLAGTGRRRLARSRRLFAFDRGLQSRFVAGTDEAGRGCLAGPLVAAAVLIDYERLSHADRRALAGLHDSKQMTEERRLEMFPSVLRAADAGQRRHPLRRRDRPPRPARDQHRSALRRAGTAGAAGRRRSASSTASRCRAARSRTGRVVQGDAHQRRDRRRLGARQGHPRPLHARGRRASTPAGASTSTSATRPRSTARRSNRSGSPPCTAARSRPSLTPSWSSPG